MELLNQVFLRNMIIRHQLTESGVRQAPEKGEVSLSLDAQQYSPGTRRHVVESKRRALHAGAGMVYTLASWLVALV